MNLTGRKSASFPRALPTIERRGPPHPCPLPKEREHFSTAQERSLNRGPFGALVNGHPLLGERAGVRGTDASECKEWASRLNSYGFMPLYGPYLPVRRFCTRSRWKIPGRSGINAALQLA